MEFGVVLQASPPAAKVVEYDSAVRVLSDRPATLATLRESVHVIRELANGRAVTYSGATVRIPWASASRLAGYGPKALALAGEVGDGFAHMREQCRWFGGMVGNHVADLVARYGTSGQVPAALTDYIAGREGYDYNQHGQAGNTHTAFVPDEIVDRFCIIGPASQHIERLAELRDLGVDQFAVYLQHDGKDQTLAAYGSEVIPALNPAGLAVWSG